LKSCKICIIALLLSLIFVGVALSSDYQGYQTVTLLINGKTVQSEVPSIIINNRTLVPLRVIAESLHANVTYNQQYNYAVITTSAGGQAINLSTKIDGEYQGMLKVGVVVNGQILTGDVPPVTLNGRTLVPIRMVAQALGCTINYDNGQVTVTSPGSSINPSSLLGVGITPQEMQAMAAGVVPAVQLPGSVTHKSFNWNYNNTSFSWEVDIPNDLLSWDTTFYQTMSNFYANSNNAKIQNQILQSLTPEVKALLLAPASINNGNKTAYVEEPQNFAYTQILASKLAAQAQVKQYDKFATAEFILSFVQSIKFVLDPYPKLAAQSLSASKDCDDGAILLCSLLKSLGYSTALVRYSEAAMGSPNGHMQGGVAFTSTEVPKRSYSMSYVNSPSGKLYYICETTNNFPIGTAGTAFNHTPTYIYPQN